MNDDLLAILRSLVSLMAEETELLRQGRWPADITTLAAAKLRLIGLLEAGCAERERTSPDWLEQLGSGGRSDLLDVVVALRTAAADNEKAIRRQIDLSRDLLDEISAEARRLGGSRQQTYRRSGRLQQRDELAPVSVNTQL